MQTGFYVDFELTGKSRGRTSVVQTLDGHTPLPSLQQAQGLIDWMKNSLVKSKDRRRVTKATIFHVTEIAALTYKK